MKKLKRILGLVLIAVSLFAIALPAMAATVSIVAAPGKNEKSNNLVIPAGRYVSASVMLNTSIHNGTAYIDGWDPNKPVYENNKHVRDGDWEVLAPGLQLGKGFKQSGTLSASIASKYTVFRFRLFGWNDNGTASVSAVYNY
jgi:hypothetical protein